MFEENRLPHLCNPSLIHSFDHEKYHLRLFKVAILKIKVSADFDHFDQPSFLSVNSQWISRKWDLND
jgi:hypothetical protein